MATVVVVVNELESLRRSIDCGPTCPGGVALIPAFSNANCQSKHSAALCARWLRRERFGRPQSEQVDSPLLLRALRQAIQLGRFKI